MGLYVVSLFSLSSVSMLCRKIAESFKTRAGPWEVTARVKFFYIFKPESFNSRRLVSFGESAPKTLFLSRSRVRSRPDTFLIKLSFVFGYIAFESVTISLMNLSSLPSSIYWIDFYETSLSNVLILTCCIGARGGRDVSNWATY